MEKLAVVRDLRAELSPSPLPATPRESARTWSERLPPAESYPPGVELQRQDAPSRDLYLVAEGLIKLVRRDRQGRELIVGLRRAGSFVGAAAVITATPHAVTAETVTRSELQRAPRETVLALSRGSASLAWSLQQLLAGEVVAQTEQLALLALPSARDRLQEVLLQLVGAAGPRAQTAEGVQVRLPLTCSELAGLISVSPEHLSRLFGALDREGVVRRRKGWLIVTDLERLRADR